MTRAEDQGTRVKVAVLGGGMGALAAACKLIELDPEAYDITVYQRGWRLGGKAASGRNRDPGKGLRIEEHGLHILMGFYEHVFHIVKRCYDELGPQPTDSPNGGIGTWREALAGSDHLHVADRYRDGHHEVWELALPAHDRDAPGTNPPEDPDVAHWMGNGLAFIYEAISQIEGASGPARPWLDWLARTLVRREGSPARMRAQLLGGFTQTSVRWALSHLFNHLGNPEARDAASIQRRRQAMTAYFVGANLLGVMSNGLWCKQDFLRYAERIDHLDYREWLHRNTGAIGEGWPELAWASPLVDAVYDLIFSHHCGFGAGTALYDTLCMSLGYRNQLYYRMNGGMGDVVFAPLYLWLRRKGVKFRFFHRVRKLGLESPHRIGQITVEEQLDLGGAEYDPLFPARGRACWPSAPLHERLPERARRRLERDGCDLENGTETTGPLRQLRRGRDFDVAVLGLPVGVLQQDGELVGELTAAHPPFAQMVQGLQTARTRAFQIWTDRDAPGMGWDGQPGMMGAYRRPFGSWADMSHVLAQEDWGERGGDRHGRAPGAGQDGGAPAAPVKGVHYFCGVDEGPAEPPATPPAGELHAGERVRREAVTWLQGSFPTLLPGWTWDRTWADEGRGSERFAAQYWRANEAPSERYVLAAPGTLRFRLAAGASGFDNLFLAGDWVKTDLNAGCVEAAAMAGVDAARAIHQRARQLVLPVRATHLPAYVDRDSDWVLRAPVQAEDVTTVAYVLRADPGALAALCAEQIADPTEGQVTAQPWPPQAGLVLLICSQMPHIQSGDEEHGTIGHFREHDVGFFVPVTLGGGGRSGIGMLAPYLFVDSAIGLSAGREIYGFSKLLARIEMPLARPGRGFDLPPGVTVTSDVVAAGRTVEQATVLEVIPSKQPASARTLATRPEWWRLLPLLGSALMRTRWTARRGEAPGGRGPSFGMPMVFLKQFRDAAEPAAACHQSLVQCGARAALAAVPRRLRGTVIVRLPWHAKPDLAGTLGLPSELETSLALQVEHDLYLPEGRQIWP